MIWRNLNASNSIIYSVSREPIKALGNLWVLWVLWEPRLKNTALEDCRNAARQILTAIIRWYGSKEPLG